MIKRKIKTSRIWIGFAIIFALFMCIVSLLSASRPANALTTETSYNTYIMGPQKKLLKSQAAYAPKELLPINTVGAEDIFLYGDKIYVADATGKCVIEMTLSGTVVRQIGLGEDGQSDGTFVSPYGIAIKEDVLYVADKGKSAIVKYDLAAGALLGEVTRPTSPLYGAQTPYVPVKIAVDDALNMYVVGEGNPNGVIHISSDGEFQGYLGANKTPTSLKTILQNLFFSEEQKEQFLTKTPPSPSSLVIDNRGLLYTITPGDTQGALKRLNTSGVSITETAEDQKVRAMDVDDDYNMYSVTSEGNIIIYADSGQMLFSFGGDNALDRFGRLVNPVAIKVDASYNLYVLDKTVGAIVKYAPTEFYLKVHKALGLYQEGYYLEAEPIWNEVLKDNANFILGYNSLARASLKHENYTVALQQFEIAEDRAGYSEAYWQIRNVWLQENILWFFVAVFALIVVVVALKQIAKRTTVLQPVTGALKRFRNIRIVDQVLYSTYFIRHPISAIEQMRYKNRITVSSALVLYALYVIVGIVGVFCQGFIWTGVVYNVNVFGSIITMLLPLILGVVCNYFVASVTEGAGKFSHVFIAAIYSFTPYILFYPIFIILSNVLTLNELVILQFINFFIVFYCVLLLLISIYQVHYYKFGGVVKNVLLTAFCFAMVVLFAVIIYLLVMQQFGFWESVIWEVFQ